jgi:hypothetical protein
LPQSHRLRLNDGSVIDLDRAGIKSWYESGLITVDSQIQKPGSREWTRLGQSMDVRQWKAPARPQGRSVPAGPRQTPSSTTSRTGTSRAGMSPRVRTEPSALARLSELPWKRWAVVATLVAVLGGGAYATSGLWIPAIFGSPETRRLRAATTSQRELADETLGLKVALPASWSLLREDHGLFTPRENARLALAAPRETALAVLSVENPPRAFVSLDAYLDHVVAERRRSDPSVRETRREDMPGGRRALATREAPEGSFDEVVSVWKDGWTYYTLAVWAPASAASADAAATALRPAFTTEGPMGARLAQALATVIAEVPLLTPRAAEMLMGQSAAQMLEPADAFRRTYLMTSRGLPALSKAEQAEMGTLSSLMYAALPARDRTRLGSYIERVRGQQSTGATLDEEMSRLAKTAVLKLPAPRRARLQVLFEKAIAAGLAR